MWQRANNRVQMPGNVRTHLTQPKYHSHAAATARIVQQRNARAAHQVSILQRALPLALTAWLDTRTQTVTLRQSARHATRASTLQQGQPPASIV
jgi:hypothetical protein